MEILASAYPKPYRRNTCYTSLLYTVGIIVLFMSAALYYIIFIFKFYYLGIYSYNYNYIWIENMITF